MNKNILIICASISLTFPQSVFAETVNGISCNSSRGYNSSQNGHIVGSAAPLSDASNKLWAALNGIPEVNEARYSTYFDKCIETKQKKISALTLSSQSISMFESECGYDEDNHSGTYKIVSCSEATACVTLMVDYDVCKDVSYDIQTGKKITKCPSGKLIYN